MGDILQHAGVKGMKWGVRKREPSVRREVKAQKLDAKSKSYQDKLKNLKSQNPESRFDKAKQNLQVKSLTKKDLQAIKDSAAVRDGKLTRREKQVIVGAAVVAVVGAYAIGAKIQSGDMNRMIMKGQAMIAKQAPSFKKNSDFAKDFTDPDLLHKTVVNGINDHSAIGGKVNCRRTTLAYELRRRGNDVVATRTTTGRGQTSSGLYNSITKTDKFVGDGVLSKVKTSFMEDLDKSMGKRTDTPFEDFSGDNSPFRKAGFLGENKVESGYMSHGIFRDLAKQPDKSRGELSMTWKAGGGHSVAWEIVKGKPVIFDTQTGEMFKDLKQFEKYGEHVKDAGFTRLDNKALNEDFLMRWAKNAK